MAGAPDKPIALLRLTGELIKPPGKRTGDAVLSFRPWASPAQWQTRLMEDSELNWLHAPPPRKDA